MFVLQRCSSFLCNSGSSAKRALLHCFICSSGRGAGPCHGSHDLPQGPCLSFCTSGNDKFWETRNCVLHVTVPVAEPAPGTHLVLSVKRPWCDGTRTWLWTGGGLVRELSARFPAVE